MTTEYQSLNDDMVGNISARQTSQFIHTMAFSRDSCSDNDSGICVDSGSEQSCSSPKCSLPSLADDNSRILPKNNCTNIVPTLIPSLKIRKGNRSQSQSRCKPMRVRFADEVIISTKDNCLQLSHDETKSKSIMRPPPSYDDVVSLHRIQRQNQDKQISVPFDQFTNTDCYANLLRAKSSHLAKSVENLALIPSYKMKLPNPNNCVQFACSSQTAPKNTILDHVHSNNAHKNVQMISAKPKFAHSMTQALQKFSSTAHCANGKQANSCSTNQEKDQRFVNRNVKARLLSIDSKGVHVVELQKVTNDGPFGFYISTGTYKNKKGIFVSRVNVPNLNPLLNIGDQIIEIDNTTTKGRSLEQTQLMMFNKNRVVLKLLPVSS